MAKNRLLFIDNLRTVMIVLVILVHLSVTYGGEGSWFYKERPADMPTVTALSFFNAVTQSYFMGLLFLLAAYFTPSSYDRKGPRPFLRLAPRLVHTGCDLVLQSCKCGFGSDALVGRLAFNFCQPLLGGAANVSVCPRHPFVGFSLGAR